MAVPRPQKSSKRRPLWWWLLPLAGALFFALALLGSWYVLHDEPPPADTDLRVQVIASPRDQNGVYQFADLLQGPLKSNLYGASIVPLSTEDGDYKLRALWGGAAGADEFLTRSQPVLPELDALLAKPSFDLTGMLAAAPGWPDMQNHEWDAYAWEIAEILQLAAARAQQAEDYPAAVREILRAQRFANRLSQAHGTTMDMLSAIVLDSLAALSIRELLNDPALPPVERDILSQAAPNWFLSGQQSLLSDYEAVRAQLNAIKVSHPLLSPYPRSSVQEKLRYSFLTLTTQPNATLALTARMVRREQAFLPEADGHFDRAAKLAADWEAEITKPMPTRNFGGRSLLQEPMSRVFPLSWIYTATAVDRLVQAGLAVRHYFDDHHARPATLAELVPQYLPAVPVDPFDGQPLRYDPGKGLIYAVGTELTDHGGSRFVRAPQNGEFIDPLRDTAQPTLELLFQKPPAPANP